MIKSELFQESYCIFLSSKAAESFARKVKEFEDSAIQVLRGMFEDAPAVVVIPIDRSIKKIETELFNWSTAGDTLQGGGFWGQVGMGYLGKEWVVVE